MDFRGTICIVNLESSDFLFVMHLNEFYKMSNSCYTKVGKKLEQIIHGFKLNWNGLICTKDL
jgi:hypothetical protein